MSNDRADLIIRIAEQADLAAIVEIYNQSVLTRQSTADLMPVSVAERQPWFDSHVGNRPLYVAEQSTEQGKKIVGWASLSDLYERRAYRISSEISVYIDEKAKGQGLGKALVEKMLELAPQCEIQQVVAKIFSNNTASINLFNKMGFEYWGVLKQVCDMEDFIADVTILGKSVR